jgi:hypothetical protein
MPRYWVIAPYHAEEPAAWDRVWKFDLENSIISIGFSGLGDVSSLSEEQLIAHGARIWECSPAEAKPACRMVHKFSTPCSQAMMLLPGTAGRKSPPLGP